jgi:hypothetical protein
MNIDWSNHPEATHFDPVDQNFLRELDHALLIFNINKGWMVPLYAQYGVTIEDCNRPLIKRPEWKGEGLPPVGTVCEVVLEREGYRPNGLVGWKTGDKITCIAHVVIQGGDHLSPVFFNRRLATFSGIRSDCFRPIRTAEQIAAEKYEADVADLAEVMTGHRDRKGDCYLTLAKVILDAGYRKQVAP